MTAMNARICLALALTLAAQPVGFGASATLDFEVRDAKRDRSLPIRVYLPPADSLHPAPVVLFSHGLGGSREGSAYLGQHWASHGYLCVFLQHPGSDDRVWKDAERSAILESLRNAASLQNYLARVQDVTAVLDQLERWQKEPGHPLAGQLDLSRVGMSGHSFGAVTTQAVMGQESVLGGARFRDPRINAAIAFSPSPPQAGSPDRAFAKIAIPVLTMTGTLDSDPVRNSLKPEDRRKVYAALPPGDKYQLVFEGGRHSDFSDRLLRLETPRHQRIHPAILAVSTAFWDAYLRGKPDAKAWLQSDAARKLLLAGDVWEWK